MQSPEYYSHPALTRYFDRTQSHAEVRKVAETLSPNFSLVSFDLKNAPKIDRNAQPAKKKEKSTNQAEVTAEPSDKQGEPTPTPAPSASKTDLSETKDKKRGKKDKAKQHGAENNEGGTSGKNAKVAAVDDSGDPVPSMIDLRVGHIVDGERSLACRSGTW
jgi:aminoacyl tRNA synthase complex-interacting multifunctional protein 1